MLQTTFAGLQPQQSLCWADAAEDCWAAQQPKHELRVDVYRCLKECTRSAAFVLAATIDCCVFLPRSYGAGVVANP